MRGSLAEGKRLRSCDCLKSTMATVGGYVKTTTNITLSRASYALVPWGKQNAVGDLQNRTT